MAGTRNQGKPKNPRYAGPEPCIGRIEFNHAPDAEDRLRRLFTLLAKHFADEGGAETEQAEPDSVPADDGPASL